MRLREATAIPNTAKPCAVGTRNVHTAIVRIDGELHRAYIKRLSAEQVAAECYAALLLRAWGLAVPEPLLVDMNGETWFGSLAIAYPDLAKRFQLVQSHVDPTTVQRYFSAIMLLANFGETPLALACDEAIANGDRNLQNVLWDGGTPVWIDHERSLGMPDSSDRNYLAMFSIKVGNHQQVQQRAVAAALAMAQDALQAVAAAVDGSDNFVVFVKQRIVDLPGRVLKRFPQPHDLLSQTR